MRRWFFVLLSVATCSLGSEAQTVFARGGNLFVLGKPGHAKRLMASGRDSDPSMSPDGKRVVFVRGTPGRTIETGAGSVEAKEIWVADSKGGRPVRIVRGEGSQDPRKVLAGFRAPQFSPDGRLIYFLSHAYATSDAVHRVDVNTRKVSFVCDGNTLEVVRKGEHRGHLIVLRHRYTAQGSSDEYWLMDPHGKEVRRIGGEKEQERFKKKHLR